MLELLKYFFETIDFLKVAEFLRKRNNRKAVAQLHIILVTAYDIIELYKIILDELGAALRSHQVTNERHRFFLNPARMASLLRRQASNLEVMETLAGDMFHELSVLDRSFAETYRNLVPGKFGILFEAIGLLEGGRLPLSDGGRATFPVDSQGVYRSLWFTWDAPTEDRDEVRKYLHGCDGKEKVVVDINNHDGDEFFRELERYLSEYDPYKQLKSLEDTASSFKVALLERFTLEDILTDIGAVQRHSHWV